MTTHLDDRAIANQFDVSGEARIYRAMRRFWHPVMYASQLGQEPAAAKLLGEALVLARLDGAVRCFTDLCGHRGSALSLGQIEGDVLRCPYHGWTYGPDGVCTSIPARFGAVIPTRARLQPYLVAERNGLIWVCLDDEPAMPIPDLSFNGDGALRVVEVPTYTWKTSIHRRIENYVDVSHFAWIHDGVLGDHEHPEVGECEFSREETHLAFSYPEQVEATTIGKNQGLGEGMLESRLRYRLYPPGTVLLEQDLPGDHMYALFFSVCPLGPKEALNFTFMARNYNLDDAAEGDRTMLEYNDLVIAQDQPVVESQRPEELPYDFAAELHIRGVDKVSIEYRKWLVELVDQLGC
jgi:vanillate O-demethylase monooxygenase subunit